MSTRTTPAPSAEARPAPAKASPPAPSRASTRVRGLGSSLARWVSPLALVGLWQLASSTGLLPEDTLASPAAVAVTAYDLAREGVLASATLVSAQRAFTGFLIGAVIGVGLATVAGLSRVGEYAIDPPMQMLRMLPHLGLVSLFIIWFGIGEQPKIILVAFGAAFPLYLNTFAGIRGIDRRILEAATAMHLTWSQRIRHVVLPGAVPHLMTGLRQSLGVAWLTLIVAEQMAADDGIGKLINDAKEFLMTDRIVVGLAVYMVLGLTTDALVRLIERKALAWRS